MNPVIFQGMGLLADGKYLPGQYAWPEAVHLVRAWLEVGRPQTGVLTLTLEVGAVLTPLRFVVQTSAQLRQDLDLGLVVAAGTVVRWQASFDGPPEAAATSVTVTMQVEPRSVAVERPALTVAWVNVSERVPVYGYDATAHRFNEVVTGRSVLTQGEVFELGLTAPALRVAEGVVSVNEFLVGGLPPVVSPRLEFIVGFKRVAVLTEAWLWLPGLVAEAPAVLNADYTSYWRRFELRDAGGLRGVLGEDGLSAEQLREPM